jgi:hypothetical protein
MHSAFQLLAQEAAGEVLGSKLKNGLGRTSPGNTPDSRHNHGKVSQFGVVGRRLA